MTSKYLLSEDDLNLVLLRKLVKASHLIRGYGSHRFEDKSLLSVLPFVQGTISFIQHSNSIKHSIMRFKSGNSFFSLKACSGTSSRNMIALARVHHFHLLLKLLLKHPSPH